MEILLVRGIVRPDGLDRFLETSSRYNSARGAAGLPTYRRLIETTDGSEGGVVVFMCEFADAAEMDRTDALLETDDALKSAIADMYEHLVPGSVSASALRDLD